MLLLLMMLVMTMRMLWILTKVGEGGRWFVMCWLRWFWLVGGFL